MLGRVEILKKAGDLGHPMPSTVSVNKGDRDRRSQSKTSLVGYGDRQDRLEEAVPLVTVLRWYCLLLLADAC